MRQEIVKIATLIDQNRQRLAGIPGMQLTQETMNDYIQPVKQAIEQTGGKMELLYDEKSIQVRIFGMHGIRYVGEETVPSAFFNACYDEIETLLRNLALEILKNDELTRRETS